MKLLRYVLLTCLLCLLYGCQQQEGEDTGESGREQKSTTEQSEAIIDVPVELPSPYYALRPLDDLWPATSESEQLSNNLLSSNYYIVLDGSGSMRAQKCSGHNSKMAVAKQAVGQFTQQIPNEANLALYIFDAQGYSERVSFAEQDRDKLLSSINNADPGGSTPLASAIRHGYQALRQQAVNQLGYGEFHLVVVTDGIASDNQDPTQIVNSILKESPVVVHTIGFCIDDRHSLNQPGMTSYKSANSPEELQQGLQAVLSEAPDFSPDHF